MSYLENTKPVTLTTLARMRAAGEKIVMLTAYDASFAALEDRCGVDVMLVGDSLGNVIQGQTSTLPVTMKHMVYHTSCVAALPTRPMLVADLPFGACHESKEQAIRNAGKLVTRQNILTTIFTPDIVSGTRGNNEGNRRGKH